MKLQIIAAAALALSMGSAAFAQDSGAGAAGIGTGANSRVSAGLGDEMNGRFFTEDGSMRSANEVSTAWSSMSAEQQASVRTECESIKTADSSANATAGQGTVSTETTASTGTTAEGATSKVEGKQMAMTELCAWVDTQ